MSSCWYFIALNAVSLTCAPPVVPKVERQFYSYFKTLSSRPVEGLMIASRRKDIVDYVLLGEGKKPKIVSFVSKAGKSVKASKCGSVSSIADILIEWRVCSVRYFRVSSTETYFSISPKTGGGPGRYSAFTVDRSGVVTWIASE